MPAEKQANKPVNRGLRRFVVYGSMLAFLVIGLSVLVRVPMFNAWLSGFVASQLRASLGEDVLIEDIEVSLVPLAVDAGPIVVLHEGLSALEVERVSIDFDWMGLGGINTLHLENPQANLHAVDGQLREFPGLTWGADSVQQLPWDTLSIRGGQLSLDVDSGATQIALQDIDLEPTGHGVGDASIGRIQLARGDWIQEAEDVRLRSLVLRTDQLGADNLLLETDLVRLEGGVSLDGLERELSGEVQVALNLAELNPLLPEESELDGKIETRLLLSGQGTEMVAQGQLKAQTKLTRRKIRTHVTELSELQGEVQLNRDGLVLIGAEGPYGGGQLRLDLRSGWRGEDAEIQLSGQQLDLEHILREESGFPVPWVGMTGSIEAKLRGSFAPFSLAGGAAVEGRDFRVVPRGLRSGRPTTLELPAASLEGNVLLNSAGTAVEIENFETAKSQGDAELFMGRGPFPVFDLRFDLGDLDYTDLVPLGEIGLVGDGSLEGRVWGRLGRPLKADGLAKAQNFEALGLPWADRIETRILTEDLKRIEFQPLHAWKGDSKLQGSLELDFQPTGLLMAIDLLLPDTRVEDLLDIVIQDHGVTGAAEGTLSLSGVPNRLSGDAELELAMVELLGEPFTDGRLVARVEEGRIVLDPLRLSREEARETVWFRGAIESSNWELDGRLGVDRVALRSERTRGLLQGDLYANIAVGGSLMSPIPKGRIALREGQFLTEEVGVSLFDFARIDQELVWSGALFEEALAVRARQHLGGELGFSLEGGWRSFPLHAFQPVGRDGRPISALLDGSFVLQGNWASGVDSLHGRAIAERLDFHWGEHRLRNRDPWVMDVIGGEAMAEGLVLAGSGMEVSGQMAYDSAGARAQADGMVLLGLMPAFFPGIELAEGPVTINVDADSARDEAKVRVEAVTTGASLRTEWFPHALEGFTCRLVASEQGYNLSGLGGSLGGGRAAMSGFVEAEAWTPTRFDLQGQLERGRIRYLTFLPTLEGDARLALEGPVDSLSLNGDIELSSVRFTERIDWEQWVIDIRESKLAEEVDTTLDDPLFSMNLTVRGQGAARIRNNLAHGDADVDLQVIGDTIRPGVLGTVRMRPGGRMFVQDREFEVARAELHYVDPWSFDPELDILLNTDIRSREDLYQIDYQVGGPFSDWYTVASSQPSLSQADINALLLFGLTREELERFGGVNAALLMEGADLLLHGVGFDNRALERLGGGSLPFDRVELVTGVSERGNQVSSETRVLLEKQVSDPYNLDLRVEFNPFRNVENVVELEKQVGDSLYLTLYRSSLEQERSVDLGGAYGLDFKLRWEVE